MKCPTTGKRSPYSPSRQLLFGLRGLVYEYVVRIYILRHLCLSRPRGRFVVTFAQQNYIINVIK